jgi:3-hydroxybutyryl-CoA dehydratase
MLDAASGSDQNTALARETTTMNDGYFLEDLIVGMTASTGKTITEADILLFSAVSTDTNPVHISAEAGAASPFKQRIAHGMLSASLISAVLGTKLPGPGTIYLGQTLRFRAPVMIGHHVIATVEVTHIDLDKKRATLKTICVSEGRNVIEGDATVLVPTRA